MATGTSTCYPDRWTIAIAVKPSFAQYTTSTPDFSTIKFNIGAPGGLTSDDL